MRQRLTGRAEHFRAWFNSFQLGCVEDFFSLDSRERPANISSANPLEGEVRHETVPLGEVRWFGLGRFRGFVSRRSIFISSMFPRSRSRSR